MNLPMSYSFRGNWWWLARPASPNRYQTSLACNTRCIGSEAFPVCLWYLFKSILSHHTAPVPDPQITLSSPHLYHPKQGAPLHQEAGNSNSSYNPDIFHATLEKPHNLHHFVCKKKKERKKLSHPVHKVMDLGQKLLIKSPFQLWGLFFYLFTFFWELWILWILPKG